MKTLLNPAKAIEKWTKRVSEELAADVVFYSGEIAEPFDFLFIGKIKKHRSQPNIILLLNTPGGSADAAYRMTRYLQESYGEGKITLFIPRYCKSAGTLVAVGVDELVMSDIAELGPLDVQVRKPDELGEWTSGLTPLQALSALRAEAFASFESHFLALREKSGRQITAKMAADVAAKLTTGWFQPIYEQLDPMRLSETQRAMMIAWHYGNRLTRGNVTPDSIDSLISDYPSHGFIIDRTEAGELFENVRNPSEAEHRLSSALLRSGVIQRGLSAEADQPEIWFLSKEECKVSADIEWKGEEHETETPKTDTPASAEKTGPSVQPPARTGDEKPVRESNGDTQVHPSKNDKPRDRNRRGLK